MTLDPATTMAIVPVGCTWLFDICIHLEMDYCEGDRIGISTVIAENVLV